MLERLKPEWDISSHKKKIMLNNKNRVSDFRSYVFKSKLSRVFVFPTPLQVLRFSGFCFCCCCFFYFLHHFLFAISFGFGFGIWQPKLSHNSCHMKSVTLENLNLLIRQYF